MTLNLYKPLARKLQLKSRKRPLPPPPSAASSVPSPASPAFDKPERSGSGGGGGGCGGGGGSVVTAVTAISMGGSAVTAFSADGGGCESAAGDNSVGTHEATVEEGRPPRRDRAVGESGPSQGGAPPSSPPRRQANGVAPHSSRDGTDETTDHAASPPDHGLLPGPQTLEVEGEDVVPLLYDFWECYVIPHRRSAFARSSYHQEFNGDNGGIGKTESKGKRGPAKRATSKVSDSSYATTIQTSNAATNASDERRAAFQLDGSGSHGISTHGKSSIGLLMYDSGGWTSYPTSSQTTSGASSNPLSSGALSDSTTEEGAEAAAAGRRSNSDSSTPHLRLERPTLSDPYPYWMWPTSRSSTFSSPWTPEEEEYWGKAGGIGVRAVLGTPQRRKKGHRRNDSSSSYSSQGSTTSAGSNGKTGKMDAHFPHDISLSVVPSPSPSPSSGPRQVQPARQTQLPPDSPSRRPTSAALLAQRRMMERRQAQRRKRAARHQPPTTVAGRRSGVSAAAAKGYATPASSARDLLWNIPEGRAADHVSASAAPERDGARRAKEPGMLRPVIPADRLLFAPVSSAIASVIEEERDRTGSLNTPPLEGLSSSGEERDGGASSGLESTDEDDVQVPPDGRKNRPDADQPNDPGDHGAVYEEEAPPPLEAAHHMQMQMQMEMPPPMDMPGMEPVLFGVPGVQNVFVMDAPPQEEGYDAAGMVPPGLDVQIEGAAAAAEGEDEPPRGMVDPAVFRAVLRSKLAASTGVFDWNAYAHAGGIRPGPNFDEILIPDDVTDVTGDVTIPLCIMEEEDWERERRRRGFPGQIEVAPEGTGNASASKMSLLSGAGKDDVSALGEPPVGLTARATGAAPAVARGEGQWAVRGDGTRPTAPSDVRDLKEEKGEVIIVGRPEDEVPGNAAKEEAIVVGDVNGSCSSLDSNVQKMTRDMAKELGAEEAAAGNASGRQSSSVASSDLSSAHSSVESAEIPASRLVTSTRPATTARPSSPPRSRSASEMSEEELSAAEEAGRGIVDPVVVQEEEQSNDVSLGVPTAFDQGERSARAFVRRVPDEERSIEISIGFPSEDGENDATKSEEGGDNDDGTLELAAAAVASASAAAAACCPSPSNEEVQDSVASAHDAEANLIGSASQETASLEEDESEKVSQGDRAAPSNDADVLRLLTMVTHSPTAPAAPSGSLKKHVIEETQDDAVPYPDVNGDDDDSDDEDDDANTSNSGWSDEEDCTTLDEESFQTPQPPTHEELHGGSVFAAFACGDLSLGSASSLASTSGDEHSETEEEGGRDAVDVMETVDERSEQEGSHEGEDDERLEEEGLDSDEDSVPDMGIADTPSEDPPSPVRGMPWSRYITPPVASASHSSASTSNNTPPSLSSLSPPRLVGSDADAVSLSSGRSGLASQTSVRSHLSQASSARIMAALGAVADSESEGGDSIVFEDSPIHEEEEEEVDGVEYEQLGTTDDDDARASAGSISRGETFDSLEDVESASAASSTLVDHIGELLGRSKARDEMPHHDVIEEEEEEEREKLKRHGDDKLEKLRVPAAPSDGDSPRSPQQAPASPQGDVSQNIESSAVVAPESDDPAAASESTSSSTKSSTNSRPDCLSSLSSSKKVKWIDFGQSPVLPDFPQASRHKRGGSFLSSCGGSCGARTAETESVTRPSEDEGSHASSLALRNVSGIYAPPFSRPDSPSESERSTSSRSSCALQEQRIRSSLQDLEMSCSEDEGEIYDDESNASSFNSSINSSVAFSDSEGAMVNDMILKLKQESARRRARLARRKGRAKKVLARPQLERMGSF